jgi:pimeloyl-ACP methyl ester carboxylesterase
VVAHSFGARAALLLAMLDPQVAAVVSLDGGIGTATGRASLEALPFYRAAAVRAPILHFYEELDEFMAPDFGLLHSLTAADRWLVSVPAMHHHQPWCREHRISFVPSCDRCNRGNGSGIHRSGSGDM